MICEADKCTKNGDITGIYLGISDNGLTLCFKHHEHLVRQGGELWLKTDDERKRLRKECKDP